MKKYLISKENSNWNQFMEAMERYKVPSENIVYADTAGNIGWQAAGMAPVRKNWSGVLPVPGDAGEYEWAGFRRAAELPRVYNPATHFIAIGLDPKDELISCELTDGKGEIVIATRKGKAIRFPLAMVQVNRQRFRR